MKMMLKEPLQSSHLNLYNTFYNMFQSSFTLIIIHSTKIIANKKIFKKKTQNKHRKCIIENIEVCLSKWPVTNSVKWHQVQVEC